MEPPSPTKGRKLVNSMKKSFRSLRIKKQKSPSASPESLKRCNSDDVGVCGDLVELDERYPGKLGFVCLFVCLFPKQEKKKWCQSELPICSKGISKLPIVLGKMADFGEQRTCFI